MSELLQKQFLFAEHFALLIQHANVLGYKIKIGEVLRSNEQAEINAMGFDGRKALVALIRNAFPLLAAKIEDNRGNGIRRRRAVATGGVPVRAPGRFLGSPGRRPQGRRSVR